PTANADPAPPCGVLWTTSALGPSLVGGFAEVRAIAGISRSDAWAVGRYEPFGGAGVATLAEHWDGSSWNVVPSPNPSPDTNALTAISGIGPKDLWAVGSEGGTSTLTERWNGTAWRLFDSPNAPDS